MRYLNSSPIYRIETEEKKMKKSVLILLAVFFLTCNLLADGIALISPNGGEKWKKGSMKQISWTATGLSHDMKIFLFKDDKKVGIIADNVTYNPAKNSYSIPWKVGEYIGGIEGPGTQYKIKIKEKGVPNFGISQGYFSIRAGGLTLKPGSLAGLKNIKVTSPAANAFLDCGKQYTIRWETPIRQAFKIELYKYNKKTKLADIGTMLLIPNRKYKGKYSYRWNIPANHPNAPGKRTIKISTMNGVINGFSKPFNFRVVGVLSDEKTVVLNPGSMQRKASLKVKSYDTSSSTPIKPEDKGLGKVPNQLRVGYFSRYVEGNLGRWWWWTMVFRSSVHFDLTPYTGSKIFLVKATLILKKKKTVSSLAGNQNHCGKGLWQLNAPWSNFYNPATQHILNISQMGGTWYLDVTGKVRHWIQGNQTNHGFLITGINESLGKVTETCVTYYTAKLELRYIKK